MKHQTKLLVLCMVVAFMAAFIGCSTPAGRTAGEVVDDATISTQVKAKLFEDEKLSGFGISVETFQGEVTLTGAVNSKDEIGRATGLAKQVKGVKKVNNLLKVK